MSIFMIKPVETIPTGKNMSDAETAAITNIEQNTNNPAVIEEQKPNMSENPVTSKNVTDQVFSLTPKPIEATEDKSVIVNVDGPVGRVFTDVLNKVLATENYAAMPLEVFTDGDVTEELNKSYPGYKIINVHGVGDDGTVSKDIGGIISEVGKLKDNEEVIMVAESFTQQPPLIQSGLGILISLEKSNNIHVCMSTSSLERVIRSWLK